MNTRSQLRAKHAIEAKATISGGQAGGDVLSGFGPLVKSCGLLAALAFAVEVREKKPGDGNLAQRYLVAGTGCVRKHKGEYDIAAALALHLSDPQIGIISKSDADGMVDEIAKADSSVLRRATAEASQFVNFLKRLAI